MSVSIFEFTDYKEYIEAHVKDLGSPWGYWGKLAQAIDCQPAYLSRCLKDKTHLTMDQILAMAREWSLSQRETEYLVDMLEMARAGRHENQNYFSEKLKRLRTENENLKNVVKRDSLEKVQDQALYYSSWLWMAIHFATSIRELQTAERLSKRFHLPPAQVSAILEKLLSLGLVIKKGDQWQFHSGEFHLEKKSPLIAAHHQNWRTLSVADAQNPESDGLHYSAVYTLSKKDFLRLKSEMLKWIDSSNKIVGKSDEEEIIAFTMDLFRL